jgi:nucleoside-diphosphate-sugar epimerase
MDGLSQLNYAVTGATGFVGRQLVQHLLNLGAEVAILVRDRARVPVDIHKNLKVIEGDVFDKEAIKELIKDKDVLVHLAAYVHLPDITHEQQDRSYSVNFLGTKGIIDACLESGQAPFILFLSTVSVYGGNKGMASENQICYPETVYGKAKLASESYLFDHIKKGSIQGCVLRPSAIIGENAPGNFSRLIKIIKLGIFPMFNQGQNRKSLIYIDDVVRGIVLAVEKRGISNGQVYNISTSIPLQISEICSIISDALGKKVLVINLPKKPVSLLLSIWDKFALLFGGKLPLLKRSLDVITSEDVISIEKIQKQLGFYPQYSVKEGIAAMVSAIEQENMRYEPEDS